VNDEHRPFWEYIRAVIAEAGRPVPTEKVRVVPVAVYYMFAVLLEWVGWAFSFGCKEPAINRRVVKYLNTTRTFDISKAKERLGYKPKVSMQSGTKRAVQHSLAHESDKKSN
jgi:sterol-4alpha-carboxylate 3-dehydrogenase (decarboxylating)